MAAMGILALAITWGAWELSFIQSAFFVVPVVTQLLNMRYILVLGLQLACAVTQTLSPKTKIKFIISILVQTECFISFLMFSSFGFFVESSFLCQGTIRITNHASGK